MPALDEFLHHGVDLFMQEHEIAITIASPPIFWKSPDRSPGQEWV